MKKTFLLFAASLSLLAFSCKKDSAQPEQKTDTAKVTTNPTPTVSPTPTVTKTPAQITSENKTAMETQGVNFTKEMTDLMSSKAVIALSSLATLPSPTKVKSGVVISDALPIGQILAALTAKSTNGTLKALKADSTSTTTTSSNNQADLQAAVKILAKTYTYNSTKGSWDTSAAESANVIKISYPSGSSNVEIKVYGLAFATMPSSLPFSNMVSSCKAYVKVDGTDVITYTFDASYDASTGVPSSLTTALTVDTYSLNYAMTYNTAKVTSDLSFKHNSSVLMAQGISIEGTLTEAKAKEIESFYNTDTNKKTSKVSEFVKTGNIYYQMMDIKIIGSIDVTKFTGAIDALSEADKNTFNQTGANAINNNCSLYAIFASTKEKIADVTVYPKAPTTGTKNEPALLLTFPDGTKSDLNTYIEDPNNFKDMKAEIAKFANQK